MPSTHEVVVDERTDRLHVGIAERGIELVAQTPGSTKLGVQKDSARELRGFNHVGKRNPSELNRLSGASVKRAGGPIIVRLVLWSHSVFAAGTARSNP